MRSKFVVARGRTLMHKGQCLPPGTEIPSGLKHLADHVKHGYVTEIRQHEEIPAEPAKLPPTLRADQELSLTDTVDNKSIEVVAEKLPEPRTAPVPQLAEPAKGEPMKPVGKWECDPKLLQGKTLEQLNVMVRERDATIQPFATVGEAIAQLTLDAK